MAFLENLMGGLGKYKDAKHAKSQAKEAGARGFGLFGTGGEHAGWEREGLFATRDRYKAESMANIEQGYKKAKGALSNAGAAARTQAKESEKSTTANMKQSMTQRGLYNTTVFDNAGRGIAADTSRALQSIDVELGNLFSQLELDKTQAVDMALGRNLQQDENSAWDWFKFMIGGAGFAPGNSNSFGFGTDHQFVGAQSMTPAWQSFGAAGDDLIAAAATWGMSEAVGGGASGSGSSKSMQP